MGATDITVYDFDAIEEHNYPNQMLPEQMGGASTVGMPKVEGLKSLVKAMTGVEIKALNERFEAQKLKGIVIVATDTMSSRKAVFDAIKMNPDVDLFIDGRMAAMKFSVYAVNPFNTEVWEKAYFPDEEMIELPCTEKSIIYNTFGIASEIGNIVKRFCNGERYPSIISKDYEAFSQSVGGL